MLPYLYICVYWFLIMKMCLSVYPPVIKYLCEVLNLNISSQNLPHTEATWPSGFPTPYILFFCCFFMFPGWSWGLSSQSKLGIMESLLIVPLLFITLRMPLVYMIHLPFGWDSHGPSPHCHPRDFHASFLMETPQTFSSSINFRTLFTRLL